MVSLGNFYPRTGKKWDNTQKTATPKVKKGAVQAAFGRKERATTKARIQFYIPTPS